MKIKLTVLAGLAFAGIAAAETVTLKVTTDRQDCIYKCGDTATFTVSAVDANGALVTNGNIVATADNYGNKELARKNVDLSKENPFIVKAKKDVPGFMRLKVANRTKDMTFKSGKGTSNTILWGVAFEPEKIEPGAPNPADFNAFWADAIKKLDETVPADVQMKEVPVKNPEKLTCYKISFATYGGRRVWGWVSIPKGEGPFPVNVFVPGAGIGSVGPTLSEKRICLTMNVHSYEQPATDDERKAVYKAQDEKYAKPCGVARYAQAGIHKSREDYFYYASILGINRAVNWLWERPEVDKTQFTYSGTSQGGGFGLMLTGLNGHFTRSCIFVPAITDLLGFRQDDRKSGWPLLIEAQRPENKADAEKWAPYFDGVNFARRITCPIRFVVGFIDESCSPSAVYSAYNVCPAKDKKMIHGIGMGHGVFGKFYSELSKWQCEK